MFFLCCAVFAFSAIASADKWCCDQPETFEDKVAKTISDNNHNNDSVIDLEDVRYFLNTYFDKNKDNKTSKTEWVLTRECRYGDSYDYSEFFFSNVDRDKDGFFTIGDVALGPLRTTPMTLAQFEARIRWQYQNYSNGWCCDQPKDFEAKISKIREHSDHNNDSMVDLADIDYDLNEYYDKNNDNKTSKVEFVLARECLFGDNVGYLEYLFNQVDIDKDGFFTMADVSKGPLGKSSNTLAAVEARVRKTYQDYTSGSIVG